MQSRIYLVPFEVWLVLIKIYRSHPNNIIKYLVCSSYKTTGYIDQSFYEFHFNELFLSLDLVTMYRMMRKNIKRQIKLTTSSRIMFKDNLSACAHLSIIFSNNFHFNLVFSIQFMPVHDFFFQNLHFSKNNAAKRFIFLFF